MLSVAVDDSPKDNAAVKRADDLFWNVVDGVNDVAAVDMNHHDATPPDDTERGYRKGKLVTEDCVEILERLDARVGGS